MGTPVSLAVLSVASHVVPVRHATHVTGVVNSTTQPLTTPRAEAALCDGGTTTV